MRWINYKHTDLERLDKSIRYVCSPKSTFPEFCRYSNVRQDKATADFALIEKRWRDSIRGRLYKHCVISFGVAELKPIDAFKVLEDIFSIYQGKYPYVFSVHTNIPYRIHGHCIMGMTHLLTGKRFSQSPEELRRFKMHYNEVMLRANLPPLKGEQEKIGEQASKPYFSSEIIHEDGLAGLWGSPDEFWENDDSGGVEDGMSRFVQYDKTPFVNGTPVPMLNYEETIDVCEAAIRRNVKQAFKLALELEKGWTTHEE